MVKRSAFHRVGQKTTITRRWARRGTRPSAPKDQRTASAYLFGAICPAEGKGAAIVMPRCDTAAMSLHLAEISTAVAAGAHAVVLLDQAGWHACESARKRGSDSLSVQPAGHHAAPRSRALRRSSFARPDIWRLTSLSLVVWPSVWPLDHGRRSAAAIAV